MEIDLDAELVDRIEAWMVDTWHLLAEKHVREVVVAAEVKSEGGGGRKVSTV